MGKRYMIEPGSDLVNHLFESIPPERMVVLYTGVGEVFSIMVRRRNAGIITRSEFADLAVEFMNEIVDGDRLRLQPVADDLVRTSLLLIGKYSINAPDAVLLCSALEWDKTPRSGKDTLVLIASDLRLLVAARAEGLTVFNPETDSREQLEVLVSN